MFTIQICDNNRLNRFFYFKKSFLIATLGLCLFNLLFFLGSTKLNQLFFVPQDLFQNQLSQHEMLKTKTILIYTHNNYLNNQVAILDKASRELESLISTGENIKDTLLLGDNYRQINVEHSVLGNRLISYKIKLGDRNLFEFFGDTNKPEENSIVEQKINDIKNNLELVLSHNDYDKEINIVEVSDKEYIGLIDNLMVFSVNKQDALTAQQSELELAQAYKSKLATELKIVKKNMIVRYNNPNKKIDYVNSQRNLSELSASIMRQQLLSSRIISSTGQRIATIYKTTAEFEANLAKTPSIYPLKYNNITSTFGLRIHPVTKKLLFHSGIDFGAFVGTSVKSTADGIVTYTGWLNGYGKVVRVYHGFGLSTMYAHLSDIQVHRNQRVVKNQFLGRSGDAGLVAGPHLHYEVRRWNIPIDPIPYLQRDIFSAKKDW